MSEPCQLADACAAYAYFNRMTNNMNLQMYCRGDFGSCTRRRLHMSGQAVPDDLAPYGGTLRSEAERPRTIL